MTTPRLSFLYPILYTSTKPRSVYKPCSHHHHSSQQEAIVDHLRHHHHHHHHQGRAPRGEHRQFSSATRGWLDQVRERHGTAVEPPPELRNGGPVPGGMPIPAEVKRPVETDRVESGKRSSSSGSGGGGSGIGKNKEELSSSEKPPASKDMASQSSPKNNTSGPAASTTSTKPPETTVLHIDPPTSSSSLRQQKQNQTQDENPAQHNPQHETPLFDSYSIVRDLEAKGFTQAQSIILMQTIRSLLISNLEHAQEELVSKSDVENRTYLFQAATSELRTEISTKRKSETERQRTERTQLQHEVDILSQRLNQELLSLKDTMKGMFDDRKMAVRMEQRAKETSIQELNYKITVSLNSDVKSEVEGLRWVLTRRAAMAVAGMAFLILASLRYNAWRIHRMEEESMKQQHREKGGGDRHHPTTNETSTTGGTGSTMATSSGSGGLVGSLVHSAAISGGGSNDTGGGAAGMINSSTTTSTNTGGSNVGGHDGRDNNDGGYVSLG